MDVDLSSEDLAFQYEVRAFLADNAHDPKTDYGQWRMNWFEKAKARGGWDSSSGWSHLAGPVDSHTALYLRNRRAHHLGICPSVYHARARAGELR